SQGRPKVASTYEGRNESALTTFVDTSVWFAAANIRDGQNSRAKAILSGVVEPLLTAHVLVETWNLINVRIHRHAAERFWMCVRIDRTAAEWVWMGVRHGHIALEKVTAADLETAWAIGEAFADQTFSIVDRTSFVVMERLGIARVASFDDDFAIYRYGRNRDRAFEVLR